MKKCQSLWSYIPVIISLSIGYVAGGYLTFGVKYLGVMPSIDSSVARTTLMLFGMGVLGSTMFSTRYWAVDINEVIYEPDKDKYLPHCFDFFGYITTIIGGGITGLILYMIARAGVGIATPVQNFHDLNLGASLVIAFVGGLYIFKVQNILEKIVNQIFMEQEQGKKATEKGTT